MNFNDYIISTHNYSNTVKLFPDFIFRGQSDSSWSLEPSLTRILKGKKLSKDKSFQLEKEIINKFSISGKNLIDIKNTISLSLAATPGGGIDFLGWLPAMQHFYAPTRCLDWTSSSLVALYFACQDETRDGAVWISDYNCATSYSESILKTCGKKFEEIVFESNNQTDVLVFMTSRNVNDRIEAQQGCFSICSNPLLNHQDELDKSKSILKKIIIPMKDKKSILVQLYTMNINSRTLFPGIDGLGKSIKEYCEIWDENSKIQ